MIDELSPHLPPHLVKRIRAKLLQRKFKREELDLCLDHAYDVFAETLKNSGQNLTETFLNETIPAMVLRWAVRRLWFSPPLLLLELGTEVGRGKWVIFGDLQAPEKTATDIRKRLENRIAHWEAEVTDLGPISDPTAAAEAAQPAPRELPREDRQSVVAPEANHRVLIEGFMERVHSETATRIKKADIWKAAGYKEASEFNRFQRDDPKASAKGTKRFLKILSMESRAFLKLQRLPRNEE